MLAVKIAGNRRALKKISETAANHSNAHAAGLWERNTTLPFGDSPPRMWHQKQKTPTHCHKDVDPLPQILRAFLHLQALQA
jgi:hypothetical protein